MDAAIPLPTGTVTFLFTDIEDGGAAALQTNLAQQAWEAGNVSRAKGLLAAQFPKDGQEDLRGFEWRYLWRLCQGDARFTCQGRSVTLSPDGRLMAVGGPELD